MSTLEVAQRESRKNMRDFVKNLVLEHGDTPKITKVVYDLPCRSVQIEDLENYQKEIDENNYNCEPTEESHFNICINVTSSYSASVITKHEVDQIQNSKSILPTPAQRAMKCLLQRNDICYVVWPLFKNDNNKNPVSLIQHDFLICHKIGSPNMLCVLPCSKVEFVLNHQVISLNNLMEISSGIERFRKFLQADYCDEVFEFILAVKQYNSLTSQGDMLEFAKHIFTQFIGPGARTEINIGREIVAEIEIEVSSGQVEQDTFYRANQELISMIQSDLYPRFVQSSFFSDFLQDSFKLPSTFKK